MLLDHSQAQHLVLDMQWLGVGRARAGFFLDGLIHDAHKFNSANMNPRPYMRTANLPIRTELRGLAGIVEERSARQICNAVHSEGGASDERGKPFVATLGITGTSVSARLPVLAIRPSSYFRGKVNREQIVPEQVILETDTASIYWELLHGPSISGSNWTPVDADSGVEMNRGATLLYSGTRVADGYLTVGGLGPVSADLVSPVASKLRLALGIQGEHPVFPSDNLVLAVTSLGAASTIRASIQGKELR